MTIQSLATEVSSQFTKQTRTNGDEYWTRKGDHKEDWIYQLCMDAHGEMLPDDWRYEFIVQALNALAEYEDVDEACDSLEPDIYTGELTSWLSSHVERAGFVNEAVGIFGHTPADNPNGNYSGVIGDIALGQLAEKQEVFDSVRESLEKRVSELEPA